MGKLLKTMLLVIILINVLNLSAVAQIHKFSHYTVSDGLSQSVGNCFFQDSEGYIWIGTQNGLNKFNGYSFEKFIHNPSDSNSISDNWIFSIVEDKTGTLWLGTWNGGINRFDRLTEKFHRKTILSQQR